MQFSLKLCMHKLVFSEKSAQHLEFELWPNPQEPDPLAAMILKCNWEKLIQNDSSYVGLISHFFLLINWFVLDLLICNLPKDYFGSKIIHISCYFPSSKWFFFKASKHVKSNLKKYQMSGWLQLVSICLCHTMRLIKQEL